ncbi:aa3-type cytochrome c oxidase subunit IV [Roseomonas indoligenes]|uniref:Aa3-type cytochrome c oxidase subunit IV n=1 Tax=Roseomonas indoligenes TaxID=2820811 RepID=A0A940S3U0_9PROT|nr:aa3-type cytochrome c oxidase subunit IV [Pararoseomonas indoligenes]MBP0491279.1 aa3-type cytochrome c oxidase subunit IV [Pararoseomonas indoligenes]
MAEAQQHVDYVPVDAKDILPERQAGWAMFTRATAWGIVAIIAVLVFLKLITG